MSSFFSPEATVRFPLRTVLAVPVVWVFTAAWIAIMALDCLLAPEEPKR